MGSPQRNHTCGLSKVVGGGFLGCVVDSRDACQRLKREGHGMGK
jgi:hypothetical protein